MIRYPKIQTLFERDKDFKVILGQFRNPVIGTINSWRVTEKIDGTNIRVSLGADNEVHYGGRNDHSQMPAGLVAHLVETFTQKNMMNLRQEVDEETEITLYGEGYGAGIQKGGAYRADKSFILFDVCINEKWWLSDEAVTDIACKLGILRVPLLGIHSMEAIMAVVGNGFSSRISENPRIAEGIVARPLMPLYDHRHKRVIIKLKTNDFDKKDRAAHCRGWGDLD